VFPVALPEFLMRAYGDAGDLVFEPFGGAGTTLLAGERTDCRVAAMELAPSYVDLAIARWQTLHPNQQVLLDDGRSHAEVAAERAETTDAR
jgi:DNA modification methylase